jgi:hypothetical protein
MVRVSMGNKISIRLGMFSRDTGGIIEKVRKSPARSLKRIEIWGLKVPRELRCLSASTPRSISFLEITPIPEEITLKIFKLRESDRVA